MKAWHRAVKQKESLLGIANASKPQNAVAARSLTRDLVTAIDGKMVAAETWFQKPTNVAPRASVELLYSAVIAEVKDEFPDFNPRNQQLPQADLELVGGAYHTVYDCLYVIVYNAAKHGDSNQPLKLNLNVLKDEKKICFEISSGIKANEATADVAARISLAEQAECDEAHLKDNRSGIPKLRQLENVCQELKMDFIGVRGREMVVSFTLTLITFT